MFNIVNVMYVEITITSKTKSTFSINPKLKIDYKSVLTLDKYMDLDDSYIM